MHTLLAAYASDDEEDDLPSAVAPPLSPSLSSSSSNSHQSSPLSKKRALLSSSSVSSTRSSKRVRLPPPPLSPSPDSPPFASTADAHDGRVRSFPHVEGNWATHVFIPVPPSPSLSALLTECSSLLPPSLPFRPLPPSSLHLSLSRTVTLRAHQLAAFAERLKGALAKFPPFAVLLSHVRVYVNDERTRSFSAVGVEGGEQLLAAVRSVDGVMREWGKAEYYSSPSLHAAVGWRPGDAFAESAAAERTDEGCEAERPINAVEESDGEGKRDASLDRATIHSCVLQVTAVHCKMGNRLTVIPLG